jgi:hypothetical protein
MRRYKEERGQPKGRYTSIGQLLQALQGKGNRKEESVVGRQDFGNVQDDGIGTHIQLATWATLFHLFLFQPFGTGAHFFPSVLFVFFSSAFFADYFVTLTKHSSPHRQAGSIHQEE